MRSGRKPYEVKAKWIATGEPQENKHLMPPPPVPMEPVRYEGDKLIIPGHGIIDRSKEARENEYQKNLREFQKWNEILINSISKDNDESDSDGLTDLIPVVKDKFDVESDSDSDGLTDTIPVVEDRMERFDPAYSWIFRAREGENIELFDRDDMPRTYWRWNPNTETHETDPSSGFTSEFTDE